MNFKLFFIFIIYLQTAYASNLSQFFSSSSTSSVPSRLEFTVDGTWVVPVGVTKISATVVGGGGGSGFPSSGGGGGSGGAGGSAAGVNGSTYYGLNGQLNSSYCHNAAGGIGTIRMNAGDAGEVGGVYSNYGAALGCGGPGSVVISW